MVNKTKVKLDDLLFVFSLCIMHLHVCKLKTISIYLIQTKQREASKLDCSAPKVTYELHKHK